MSADARPMPVPEPPLPAAPPPLHRLRWVIPYLLLLPGSLWLVGLFVIPMVVMLSVSLQTGTLATGFTQTFNFGVYPQVIAEHSTQFLRSIEYGLIVTVVALLIGYPMAYTIAFRGGRYRNILLLLVILPFFTSYLIRTISWKFILADQGFVLGPLKEIGVLDEGFRLLATPVAVVSGITYNFLPFVVLPLYVALERIDPRMIEAAQDLYASRFEAFRRVTLPLSLPGVFAASLLCFIPAVGDFINAELLGSRDTVMIGNVAQRQFLVNNNYPEAAAISFILMGGILIAIFLYARALGQRGTQELMETLPAGGERASSSGGSFGSRVGRWMLPAFTALAVAYLFLPIVVMVVFGFNDPAGRFNLTWQGFTLENYATILRHPALTEGVINSVIVATVSTIVATILGTLIALAMTRYRFRGQDALGLLIFIPIATPEIVMGAALLSTFVSVGVARDLTTVIISHIMFNITFVTVTVRARLIGFDRQLEESAMDLGADGLTTFRKVTFPLIFPGIMAAAMLAFALSIDDFVITLFTAGQTITFPLWVYGAARFGVPPQVNVMGTIIFAIALVFIGLTIWWQRRDIAAERATIR